VQYSIFKYQKALYVKSTSLTERLPSTNIPSQGSGYQTGPPEYPGTWRKWKVRLKAKLILPKCWRKGFRFEWNLGRNRRLKITHLDKWNYAIGVRKLYLKSAVLKLVVARFFIRVAKIYQNILFRKSYKNLPEYTISKELQYKQMFENVKLK
jgi:hypothetical protein